MGNMGSPGIIDLLYPGLESHRIFKSVGSWEAMENKVIWAVLHLQTKETGKSYTQSRNLFQEKWPNLGYGKMWRVTIEVLEKSWNFLSSIGNTVRDYFKDTVTPHFFNVAIRRF